MFSYFSLRKTTYSSVPPNISQELLTKLVFLPVFFVSLAQLLKIINVDPQLI